MNNKSIPMGYSNDLMFELEKAFYDERGKGARFRTTTVGRQYFAEKVLPLINSDDIDHILQTIGGVLKNEGIAADLSYNKEDRLLRVQVKNCIHQPVEKRLIEMGIEPFTCVPANLVVLAIEEKLDIPVELAEIKVMDDVCQLLLVMFEKRPFLD